MRLKEGLTIYDADGDKVGDIARVVLDPVTMNVTHVVVEKGFVFKEDRVVPAGALKDADDGAVYLDPGCDAGDFPPFEERTYLGFDPATRAYDPATAPTTLIFFPPVGSWGIPSYVESPAPAGTPDAVRNVPDGSVALEAGADVYGADGESLGRIAEVVTGSATGHVTHLVIEEGLLFKDRKLVPSAWVASVADDGVRLAVSSDVIESVPEYEEH